MRSSVIVPEAMLAAALQAEVAAYVEAFADDLDERGRRLVVRNGSHAPLEGPWPELAQISGSSQSGV